MRCVCTWIVLPGVTSSNRGKREGDVSGRSTQQRQLSDWACARARACVCVNRRHGCCCESSSKPAAADTVASRRHMDSTEAVGAHAPANDVTARARNERNEKGIKAEWRRIRWRRRCCRPSSRAPTLEPARISRTTRGRRPSKNDVTRTGNRNLVEVWPRSRRSYFDNHSRGVLKTGRVATGPHIGIPYPIS